MRLGNIFVEAKLTEGKYGPKDKDVVRRYKDFDKIFKVDKLRQTTTRYYSYQLIRNILAAYHYHYSFFFLCDERRPDLRGEYQTVCNAIRCETLRLRCSVILWQEMASVIPGELKIFLSEKYGIQ